MEPLSFFDLPRELRDMIYEYVCCSSSVTESTKPKGSYSWKHWRPREILEHDDIVVVDFRNSSRTFRSKQPPMNLFLSNSKIYQESARIWYGKNRFFVNCVGQTTKRVARTLLSSPLRVHIRHLRVATTVNDRGRRIVKYLLPKLKAMVHEENLENLVVVEIDQRVWEVGSFKLAEYCPELVEFLADPKLKKVPSFCMNQARLKCWCEDHAHSTNSQQGSMEYEKYYFWHL